MSEPGPAPLVPPLAVAGCAACIAGAAALAHCAIIASLLKRRLKTGIFSLIIQLGIADIMLLGTIAVPELWSLNFRTWQFGTDACVAYQGLNVFTSTLSTYVLIAITLHALTTNRLEEKSAERRIKRNSREEDEEIRSSQHSLVANSDSSTPPRTMNVDYRVSNTRVPAALPTLFMWILAASLSIPEFALARISHDNNIPVCTIDSNHQFNVHLMLTVFNLILPLFIISVSSCLIVYKLKSKKLLKPGIVVDRGETVAVLKLSLWLVCVHILLCTPRLVVNVYQVYSSSISSDESALNFPMKDDTVAVINLMLSCAYVTATLIRPLVCVVTIPQVRSFLVFNRRVVDL